MKSKSIIDHDNEFDCVDWADCPLVQLHFEFTIAGSLRNENYDPSRHGELFLFILQNWSVDHQLHFASADGDFQCCWVLKLTTGNLPILF